MRLVKLNESLPLEVKIKGWTQSRNSLHWESDDYMMNFELILDPKKNKNAPLFNGFFVLDYFNVYLDEGFLESGLKLQLLKGVLPEVAKKMESYYYRLANIMRDSPENVASRVFKHDTFNSRIDRLTNGLQSDVERIFNKIRSNPTDNAPIVRKITNLYSGKKIINKPKVLGDNRTGTGILVAWEDRGSVGFDVRGAYQDATPGKSYPLWVSATFSENDKGGIALTYKTNYDFTAGRSYEDYKEWTGMIDLATAKQIVLDFAGTKFDKFIVSFTRTINKNFKNDIIKKFFESSEAKDSRNSIDSERMPTADLKWKRGRGGWSYSNGLIIIGLDIDSNYRFGGPWSEDTKADTWWPRLVIKPNTTDSDINKRASKEIDRWSHLSDDFTSVSTDLDYKGDYKVTSYQMNWKNLSKRNKCPDQWSDMLLKYRDYVDRVAKRFGLDKEFDMSSYLEFIKACQSY